MDYSPKLVVTRFEKLKPGDLFMVEMRDVQCVALKAIDLDNDGDTYVIPLGPTIPSGRGPAQFISQNSLTVTSFGDNYRILLPVEPIGWTTKPPPVDTLALAMRDDELYLRANFSLREDDFQPCFIRLSDGKIVYGMGPALLVYVVTWSIEVDVNEILSRVVLAIG